MRSYFIAILCLIIFFACNNRDNNARNPTTLSEYFNYGDTGVQSAGIKMIPIKTPVGNFNVWTKRFGNNAGPI
jgi:proline iminopeptidase